MTTMVPLHQNLTALRFAALGLPSSDFHRIIVWEIDPDEDLKTIIEICEPISKVSLGSFSAVDFFNKNRKWWAEAGYQVSIEIRQPSEDGR